MLKGHLFHVLFKTYFLYNFLAITFDHAPVTSYLDF